MTSLHRIIACFALLAMLTACGDENVVTADTSTADTSTADTTVEDTGPADPCDGKADGESCDDGDPCTLDDVCSAGACVGGSNDPCESDSTCQTGTCVPGEGCKYENADDGTECSVTCFEEATCIAGECKANADTAVVCASPEEAGNPCLEELQCDLETGECTVEIFKPEGTSCDDDGNLCSKESCSADGECVSTGDVENCSQQSSDFPCLKWACDAKDGTCKDTGFIGEVSCDDGNACTKNDTCSEDEFGIAECVGEAIPVDDGNPCTDDYCKDGEFFHDFLAGASCETGDACSPLGTCEGTNADDGYCKFDGCECNTDADCAQDDDLCAGQSYCDKTGDQPACKVAPETVVVCPLGDKACHVNTCVPETGLCTSVPVDDGVLCDDGDACSVGDICQGGICEVGEALECDDGLFCNGVESCDAVNGCTNGTPPTLDDGIDCTKDTCDEDADVIVHTPSDALCDDGDACNGEDFCTDDGCVAGEPVDPDDGDDCTLDSCVDGKVVNEPIANCGLSYEPEPGDYFGYALASHGDILAVGAPGEDSCDAELDQQGCQVSGLVAVYNVSNDGQDKELVSILKSPKPQLSTAFGQALAMTKNWLAVGTASESSCLAGVNPPVENMDQGGCANSGAVFLYKKTNKGWTYHSWLKAPQVSKDLQQFFGYSIVLHEDNAGLISLAVGAPHPELDDKGSFTGEGAGEGDVYFYVHDSKSPVNQWEYLAPLSESPDPTVKTLVLFGLGSGLPGWSLAAHADGLAVGAPAFSYGQLAPGVVLVSGNDKVGFLVPEESTFNPGSKVRFGASLSFYKDTEMLAVGAPGHSACTPFSGQLIDAVFGDWECENAGAVYLYENVNVAPSADINGLAIGEPLPANKIFKATNPQKDAQFGHSVSWIELPEGMAPTGYLGVGAPGEASCASTADGYIGDGSTASDTDCPGSGATYTFWDASLNDLLLEGGVDPDTVKQGISYSGVGYKLLGITIGAGGYGYSLASYTAEAAIGQAVGVPFANDNTGIVFP